MFKDPAEFYESIRTVATANKATDKVVKYRYWSPPPKLRTDEDNFCKDIIDLYKDTLIKSMKVPDPFLLHYTGVAYYSQSMLKKAYRMHSRTRIDSALIGLSDIAGTSDENNFIDLMKEMVAQKTETLGREKKT